MRTLKKHAKLPSSQRVKWFSDRLSDESDDEEEERPRKRRMAERAAEGEMEDEEVSIGRDKMSIP